MVLKSEKASFQEPSHLSSSSFFIFIENLHILRSILIIDQLTGLASAEQNVQSQKALALFMYKKFEARLCVKKTPSLISSTNQIAARKRCCQG